MLEIPEEAARTADGALNQQGATDRRQRDAPHSTMIGASVVIRLARDSSNLRP